MSKKEALYRTLKSTLSEKIAVIHSAFEDAPITVALVEVEPSLSIEDKLEIAFMKTNSINSGWWNNYGITPMFDGKSCRSTSVGDKVLLENGKKFVFEPNGWSDI